MSTTNDRMIRRITYVLAAVLCLSVMIGHGLSLLAQIRRAQAEHLERMKRLDKAYETMQGVVKKLEEMQAKAKKVRE